MATLLDRREVRRGRYRDDYEQELDEYLARVNQQYADSLVAAGAIEAEIEEEAYQRRVWVCSFVRRLLQFVTECGDGSPGAASLEEALRTAELRPGEEYYLVWIGPKARRWLVRHRTQLRDFFNGRYRRYVRDL